MALPWLKLWTEARVDAKLRLLSDAEFRVWFALLCYSADQPERGTLNGTTGKTLAVEVARGNEKLLERTLQKLEDMNVIERDPQHITMVHFAKRQQPQTAEQRAQTAARVRKHRERKRLEEERNAVTPLRNVSNDE